VQQPQRVLARAPRAGCRQLPQLAWKIRGRDFPDDGMAERRLCLRLARRRCLQLDLATLCNCLCASEPNAAGDICIQLSGSYGKCSKANSCACEGVPAAWVWSKHIWEKHSIDPRVVTLLLTATVST
jgi:hypothetical protein